MVDHRKRDNSNHITLCGTLYVDMCIKKNSFTYCETHKTWTPEIFMRRKKTKPQTVTVISLWFCSLLACPELYCNSPVHNQYSWNFSGVHGFQSLTVFSVMYHRCCKYFFVNKYYFLKWSSTLTYGPLPNNFLSKVCFWQKEKYCLPWNIVPVKRYVKMASKLDFGSAIFLGKGKSGISAGKMISHSREDGLVHRFFSTEDWPFAAPL